MSQDPYHILPIPALCRGERTLLSSWIEGTRRGSLRICAILIILGCGTYGFTIGYRNGWEMAAWVALKLPAIIFLTLFVNGLLNGMIGLILGSGIGFRQSLQFLLTGFAIMSVIVGAPLSTCRILERRTASPGTASTCSSTLRSLHLPGPLPTAASFNMCAILRIPVEPEH